MKATAIARHVRLTPRKTRAVADLVRGKNVLEALELLRFTRRAPAELVAKTIRSAAANARNMEGGEDVEFDDLRLETICVDEAPTLKRFRPVSRGQMHPYRKRTCHVSVTVSTR